MQSYALYIFIAVPGLLFSALTIFLGKYKKKPVFIKYIPAAVSAAVAIGFLIKAYKFSEGFEALGYFIMMMISAAVSGISAITAVVLEILNRRRQQD